MPPPTDLRVPCSPLTVTTESINGTAHNEDIDSDDLNALLYIVVTLLFYSLGIVVGIITYLKREKREMEESKTFEMFMSLKNDPFTATKVRRVQIVTEKLEELERVRIAREMSEHRERELLMKGEEVETEEGEREGDTDDENESNQLPTDTDSNSERPNDLDVSDSSSDAKDNSKRLQPKKQANVFQVSPSGEPISSVVAKIFDSERRGGLPNSPKALHLFKSRGRLSRDHSIDTSRGRSSRDQSIDSSSREKLSRDQSEEKVAENSTSDIKPPLAEPEGCLVTNV